MTPFTRSLFANLQTAAMSALLALLVWFYAYAQDTGESDIPLVPIVVEAPPGVLTTRIQDPTGNDVQHVRLQVYGSRSALRDVARRSLSCRILLSQVQIGDEPLMQEVVLGAREFGMPGNVQVRALPASVRVTLVKEGVQRMRVRTADCWTGAPRAGFRILDVTATPTFVDVRGPSSVVGKYREIQVARVDVTDQAEEFSQVTTIVGSLDGAAVQSDSRITLRFSIQEEEVVQEYKLKVHVLRPIALPLRLENPEPEILAVRVRGPRSQIAELKETDLVLYADLFALYRDPDQMQPGDSFKPPLKLEVLNEKTPDVRLANGNELEFAIRTAK